MGSYWFKIVLGAFAVFGVGMLIAQVVDSASTQVEERVVAAMDGAQVVARLPETLDPLQVDGAEIGRVTRIQIDPENDMTLTVTPADSAVAARVGACAALVGKIDGFFDDGLACRPADSLSGYGTFGHVVLAGTGTMVPLYATHAEVSEFHSEGHDTSVDIQADSAGETRVHIADDHGNDRVNIQADSAGNASIEIRGEDGRPIFRLNADAKGVRINADSN